MTYDTMTETELDAAVAKRLGWKEVAKDWWEKPCETLPNSWCGRLMLPKYSTDIAAAMGLVGDMRFSLKSSYVNLGLWVAKLSQKLVDDADVTFEYSGVATTPARAICLAWLMAMDAKEAK